jgi:tyrosinase
MPCANFPTSKGIFLTWHRYFTWAYEEKLRNECGYQGTVPYWEWGLDVNNPAASPVFDGSETSLGGNGEYIPHSGMILTEAMNPDALIPLPPGTGGGCVRTGPFANMTVHIGPVALAQYGTSESASVANPLDDNSRCLKRDLNAGIAARFTSFRNTTSLILQNHDVEHFQAIMQADPRYVHGELGVHGGGHFTIGGDPGADPFISPGDPAFFLHHSQIDRIYWIWQMLDFPNRQVSVPSLLLASRLCTERLTIRRPSLALARS